MTKLFKKHTNSPIFYIYMVDVMDIAGSLKEYVLNRLLEENVEFCVVVNKLDIINEKYLNKHAILEAVRKRMMEFIEKS